MVSYNFNGWKKGGTITLSAGWLERRQREERIRRINRRLQGAPEVDCDTSNQRPAMSSTANQ